MELLLNRNGTGKKTTDVATIGKLKFGVFECYTLEDDYDEIKEYGHTRIPSGRYEIKLRTEGKAHWKYAKRFPGIHKGMLHLQNVPGYKWVLIHCGNKPKDTEGCILVGSKKQGTSTIIDSVDAYKKVYPIIATQLTEGHKVFINIID